MSDSLCAKLLVLNSVGCSHSPQHDCPSPVYPSLQVQIWEPSVLLQLELTWQTWLPSLHSLTSVNKNELPKGYLTEWHLISKFLGKEVFLFARNFVLIFAQFNAKIIPWQDCPSPVYPSLQVQFWEPLELVQFTFVPQPRPPSLHSLTSVNTNDLQKITEPLWRNFYMGTKWWTPWMSCYFCLLYPNSMDSRTEIRVLNVSELNS